MLGAAPTVVHHAVFGGCSGHLALPVGTVLLSLQPFCSNGLVFEGLWNHICRLLSAHLLFCNCLTTPLLLVGGGLSCSNSAFCDPVNNSTDNSASSDPTDSHDNVGNHSAPLPIQKAIPERTDNTIPSIAMSVQSAGSSANDCTSHVGMLADEV